MIGLLLAVSCHVERPLPPDIVVVSQEQQVSWQRVFNPFLVNGSARWPTTAGIYEPLLIFNPLQGEYVPWLATSYKFNDDATTLTLSLRNNVLWSDGQSLGTDDVQFTFELLQRFPALDTQGLWQSLDHITTTDNDIQFHCIRPCFSGLERIAHQVIVPEHIWRDIEDPLGYQNPNPIASGPFTEITQFSSQCWTIEKNPYYWQNLGIQGLQFPALPSNEQATLALLQDEVDWAGNFIPAIDRIFVEKNSEDHHYWFPLLGASVLLYPNHQRPPFDDIRVRKAISYAIDRELLVKVALHNYSKPADESGLSSAYDKWKTPLWDNREKWTEFNPQKAFALLEESGWIRDKRGKLYKENQPFILEIAVVSGWSDWVRAAQVIARSLQNIGIDAVVKNQDFGSWFQNLQLGQFDLSLGWSQEGANPVAFYQSMLSANSVQPIGKPSSSNWHRYAHTGSDELIAQFESTADTNIQRSIVHQLQQSFIETAPALPLFLNPSWGEYNSKRFDGFPSEANPYARLSPNHGPEALLVLTRLQSK